MSLLTTYGDDNKNVLMGKTQRITCGTPTDPSITVKGILGENVDIQVKAWYEMICHSTASFEYVGMTYAAAATCRDAMVAKFTRAKSIWKYKETLTPTTQSDGKIKMNYEVGWQQEGTGTVQEAEVALIHVGGHMYSVQVQVDCEDIKYTTTPSTTTFTYPSCMSDVS